MCEREACLNITSASQDQRTLRCMRPNLTWIWFAIKCGVATEILVKWNESKLNIYDPFACQDFLLVSSSDTPLSFLDPNKYHNLNWMRLISLQIVRILTYTGMSCPAKLSEGTYPPSASSSKARIIILQWENPGLCLDWIHTRVWITR